MGITKEEKLSRLHVHDSDPWEVRPKIALDLLMNSSFHDEADHFDVISDDGVVVARVNRNSNKCLQNLCLILTAPRLRRAVAQCRNMLLNDEKLSDLGLKEINDLLDDASGLNPEVYGDSW